jgi:hypothetical protein
MASLTEQMEMLQKQDARIEELEAIICNKWYSAYGRCKRFNSVFKALN